MPIGCSVTRVHETDGVAGVLFAVWAPNAERVSVVGEFNRWDGRSHPMRVHGNGVWELFIPDLDPDMLLQVRGPRQEVVHGVPQV